ncbi:hypothetical protein IAE35_20855 [Pseudomonas sp. S75]|uniref:hypothetical protein n=1 Tax=unclassified Pseudomonas TaxID=196821 RepID=UPI001906DCB9|nr:MULTISPECIES: hypothetical protein [unclassified Pseudomonas]MBJ9976275.1 hypothetical protein [Pseudomonas sp. S30]MBK0155796.1 hypothetical protein [Pseudomonas sp. S75]
MNAPSKILASRQRSGIGIRQLQPMTIVGRDEKRTIVPISYLEQDLEIRIARAEIHRNDFIQLVIDGQRVGEEFPVRELGFDDPAVTEFVIQMPTSFFPAKGTDRILALDYFIEDLYTGEGDFAGLEVRTRFDQIAPGGKRPGQISLTPEQASGITEKDLQDDKLLLEVNSYFGAEVDDTIEFWIGSRTDEASGTWLGDQFTVIVPGEAPDAYITRTQLEAAGDGWRYLAYRLRDWAGNVSVMSSPIGVAIAVQLPTLFPAIVPEFEDDGLITYEDAYPDVEVRIPLYSGAAAGDVIAITWGGIPVATYTLTDADVGGDPVAIIGVPYAVVKQAGNGTVDVAYEMRRPGQLPAEAAPTPVEVNLTTPGGPDPDPNPELPWHGNIQAPLIKCGASPDNTIESGDFGEDATATIFRLGVDGQPIWEVGDIIQLKWDNIEDPQLLPITITPQNEGADIVYPVPFDSVIEPTGAGEFNVSFKVTRYLPTSTGGTVPSHALSPTQIVTVSAGNRLPNDGEPLAPATFPERRESINTLQYRLRRTGTFFRIPLAGVTNIELSKNPKVSYDFVGVVTPDGQETPPAGPHNFIEASRLPGVDIPLTQKNLDDGWIDVRLEYPTLLIRICRNGAFVNYSLKNDQGVPVHAGEGYVYVAMNEPGTNVCILP